MRVGRTYQYRLSRARRLSEWYQRSYGRYISRHFLPALSRLLERLPVNTVLQTGIRFEKDILTDANESVFLLRIHGCESAIIGAAETLPVQSSSLDCVVVLHELNIAENPHRLLREADRVLADDGYLVIVGFNPYSILGCMKPICQLFGWAPWICRFHTIGKLRDWLELLDFDVWQVDTFSYTLPFWSERLRRPSLAFYGKLAALKASFFGNVYCVTARKRTLPLTRLRVFKRKRGLKFSSAGLNPSTRTQARASNKA